MLTYQLDTLYFQGSTLMLSLVHKQLPRTRKTMNNTVGEDLRTIH